MKSNVVFCLLLMVLVFSACLKNEDNTAEGPKAQIAITHVSFNTPALDLTVDKNKLTTTPIAFGSASGSTGNFYLPIQAGLRQLILTGTSNALLDKNFAVDANKYYSMFVFDTMKNNTPNVFIIDDDTTTIDTLARARFFHFIPGKDTLTALLIKTTTVTDTAVLASNLSYLSSFTNTFPVSIKPGSYRLEMKLKGSIIYRDTPVVIQARKLYSFIAKGTSGGTGANMPSVMILQNK